jgi:(2Fe-2S) ferredoxin
MSDIDKVGFDRPKTEPLPGTVKFYERHLFVCTEHAGWPERIELGGGFPKALWEAVVPRMADMPLKVKMTACQEPGSDTGHDILVFPDGVRYLGIEVPDIPILVEDHLVGNRVTERLAHEPLAGYHVFVCVHANRDPRCGACGPPVAHEFAVRLAERGLTDSVAVRRSSHVGGHRFAGNVLIYPGGVWYGYVTPDDVDHIIDQHILQGEIVKERWRGAMATTPDQQMALRSDRSDGTSDG